MRGNRLLQKGAAITAILLFGGLSIAPFLTCTIGRASVENIVVDMTIRTCGLRGFQDFTVALSRQQYQDLEQSLVDLRVRLNQTKTWEEAGPLFKEAVRELNKYGLLPKGMNVEQAQNLVVGDYQNSKLLTPNKNNIFGSWTPRYDYILNRNAKNVCCVLSAVATKIPGYLPTPIIIPFSLFLLFGLLPAIVVSLIGADELANNLAQLGFFIWNSNPFRIFNYMVINGYEIELRSFGLKGSVSATFAPSGIFKGYSGFMLSSSDNSTIFLGFAFSVDGL